MLQIDRTEFAMAISAMFATHGRNMGEHAIVGWWDALKDLKDAKTVIAAIRELTKTLGKLPVPKDVRDWYHSNVIVPDRGGPAYGYDDPRWPLPSEVLIARRMPPGDVLVTPLMGRRMLDYLAAHPEPGAAPARPQVAADLAQITAKAFLSDLVEDLARPAR